MIQRRYDSLAFHLIAWTLLAALAALSARAVLGQDAGVLTGQALVDALRAGGFNVLFRHAATEWSQSDHIAAAGDWTSCDDSRVRQLSDSGRRAARDIGEAVRELGIPVGQMLASPYCRTMETARLMGLGSVEATTDVMNLRVSQYFGGRQAIVERARRRLARVPGAGTNTFLVAHGNITRAATDVYPEEGEGIVFRPDERGGFAFVGRLAPDDWARVADADRARSASKP